MNRTAIIEELNVNKIKNDLLVSAGIAWSGVDGAIGLRT
jgi:hypothetical protein